MGRARLAAVLSFVLAASLLVVAPAAAAPGSVGGLVVEDGTGVPLEGVTVEVYDLSETLAGSTTTAVDGSYQVDSLVAGSYRVSFSSPAVIDEWHLESADFASATDVLVSDDTLALVDAELAPGGALFGLVTDSVTSLPIDGALVEFYDGTETLVTSTAADPAGNYRADNLGVGDYWLFFSAVDHIDEWHSDAADFASALPVSVVAGTEDEINAALVPYGSIEGTVSQDGDGVLEGVTVEVYDPTESLVDTVSTIADGTYQTAFLPAGNYRLRFVLPGFVAEWHADAADFASASDVGVVDATTTTVDAALAPLGTIAGTVTEEGTGTPIEGAAVEVYDLTETLVTSGTSGADGTYETEGLPANGYRVLFATAGHVPEWHSDAPDFASATDITVSNDSTTAVDAALVPLGSISGTVVEFESLNPLEGVGVQVYDLGNSLVSNTNTAPDGTFAIPDLAPGFYRVWFNSSLYVDEWYQGVPDFDSATDVEVQPGVDTSGIDADLEGGWITGTVTEVGSGLPVHSVYVEARDLGNGWVAGGSTQADGTYMVAGLPAGIYRLVFDAPEHVDEWYDDAVDFETAADVIVTTGPSSGIDAGLVFGGSISGTVTDLSLAPIGNVNISVYDDAQQYVGSDYTDSSGVYSVAGLASGAYTVRYSSSSYQDEWYDDAPDSETATTVDVTLGSDTPGIDAELTSDLPPETGSISGTVTDVATGLPLSNVNVAAFPDGLSYNGEFANTGVDGTYSIDDLEPGWYDLRFRSSAYVDEWHLDAADQDEATAIEVVAGVATTIDAGLDVGGSIGGIVTDAATGVPLPSIYVYVYDLDYNYQGDAYTGASGAYLVAGLAAGEYRIQFRDYSVGYTTEWYVDARNFDSATNVSVVAGVVTPVDAELALEGAIIGLVTDDEANPLGGIHVQAFDYNQYRVAEAFTDIDGLYRLDQLPAGDFRISFGGSAYEPSQHYVGEWYNDVGSFAAANEVHVSAGITTTGIDAQLAIGGAIAGTVTDDVTGLPIEGVSLYVYDIGYDRVKSTTSSPDGSYVLPGLAPGSYRLSATSETHVDEWHLDATDFYSATDITVIGTETVTVDVGLAEGGSIAGFVTDLETGLGIPYAMIDVYDDGMSWVAWAEASASGTYRIDGLAPGSYRIRFDSWGAHIPEWHLDAASFDTATWVTVAAGATTTIDATLSPGGTISGTVVDDITGLPIEGIWVRAHTGYYDYAASAYTAPDGSYTLDTLAPGNYRIQFEADGHINEWHADASDYYAALDVAILSTETVTIDAGLDPGATISGDVTEEGTNVPVADVLVTVYWWSEGWVAQGYSTPDGSYSISGIPAGNYRIGFQSGTHLDEWHLDASDYDSAADVAVDSGSLTTIDAVLEAGATISGTVTEDVTGLPIESVRVEVYESTYQYSEVAYEYTEFDGTYTISGLPPGTYRVFFESSSHIDEWHPDAAEFDSAADVAIVGGTTTTVDASLAAGGSIDGIVFEEGTSTPIPSARVYLYNDDYDYIGYDWSSSSGYYQFDGLAADNYRLRVTSDTHLDEWHEDASGFDGALDVAVVSAGTTTVDVGLAPAGSIGGVITDSASGSPISDVVIEVYTLHYGYSPFRTATSGADGTYLVEGLDNGSYRVQFVSNTHVDEWYLDVPGGYYGYDQADDVAVSSGVTTAVDAELVESGSISGTVASAASAAPIGNAQVVLLDLGGGWITSVTTDPGGAYSFGGVDPGAYLVEVESTGSFAGTLYDGASSLWTATPVEVLTAANTSGIDFALDEGGTITGRITDELAPTAGLDGVQVQVYPAGERYGQVAYTATDADGYYTLSGLPAGDYSLQFQAAWDSPYTNEWWDNAADFDLASAIPLALGETVTADASLAPQGTISGVITDEATGLPIEGAYATVLGRRGTGTWDPEPWDYAYADASGAFTTGFLNPAEYAIQFNAAGYESEVWDDLPGSIYQVGEAAVPVLVTLGADTGGTDAALTPDPGSLPGSLAGTVYDESTLQPLANVEVRIAYPGSEWSYQSAMTDGAGYYEVTGVLPGDYKVGFFPGSDYAAEWHLDATSFATATVIAVVADTETVVDGHLVIGASMAGAVTRPDGSPVGSANVRLSRPDGSWVANGYTDSGGTYLVEGLAAGTYLIQADAPSHQGLVDTWFDGSTHQWLATLVPVAASEAVVGIDIELDEGGTISGTITDALTGTPRSNTRVEVTNGSGDWFGSVDTNAAGQYETEALPSGNYLVVAVGYESDGYLNTWFDGALSEESADSVAVLAGNQVTGIDIAQASSGGVPVTVTGTVSRDGGVPFWGVEVEATYADGYNSESTFTDLLGAFELILPSGEYTLALEPPSGSPFKTQYYDNQLFRDQRDTLAVGADPVAVGNTEMLRVGTVAGTVTDSAAAPLEGVRVQLYAQGALRESEPTAADGSYEIEALPGAYTVKFDALAHIDEWYDDVATEASASPIVIGEGAAATGVNAQLDAGGSISGALGSPDHYYRGLRAYDAAGDLVASEYVTRGLVTYSLDGLRDGTYYLRLMPDSLWHGVAAWYGGATDEWWTEEPTAVYGLPVVVSGGGAVTGIDLAYADTSFVTGSFSDSTTGEMIGYGQVYAHPVGMDEAVTSSYSDIYDGEYNLPLGPGTYLLEFGAYEYAPQWWDGVSDRDLATPITVTIGEDLTHNVVMHAFGGLSGSVADSGLQPVNLAQVDLFDPLDLVTPVKTVYTAPDGTYLSDTVPPGSYLVRATDPFSGDEVWFDGAADPGGAAIVTVASRVFTTDIDLLLGELPTGLLRVATLPALPSQVLVDGVPMDSWGLTWVKVPVGDHTVEFSDVQGFSTPAAETVSVSEGATTTVNGSFVERGWLQVTTSPAVPATIYVDGNPMNDWGVWTDLDPGAYEVCFGDAADFATPACESVTVTGGANTLVEGVYVSDPGAAGPSGHGYLRVTSDPAVPAQILIDGVPRDSWGLNWVKLDPGSYEVSFTDIQGFTTPEPQTITVNAGETTVVSGDYSPRGWLQVTTSPALPGTVFVDGLPRNDWGMWTDLAPAFYEVCFGDVAGYTTPACETVEVTAGVSTPAVGGYIPEP